MPSIPLPFLVAVLLLILLARAGRGGDDAPANRPFLLLIAACALQSILIGLRWGYGVEPARYGLPIVAATLPPLVYASFGALAQDASGRASARAWMHVLAPGVVAALVVLWPQGLDFVIMAVYLGYGAVLLRLARRGPDALGLAPLEGVVPAHRALLIAAMALAASAMVDLIVLLDFEWARGEHAAVVVGAANLGGPLVLGIAAMVAARSRPPTEALGQSPAPTPEPSEDDGRVIGTVDELMRMQALFRDANLNLNRLARKAGIPARRISIAVNRLRAKNVSQYINEFRIADACRLLAETDEPVTRIMFEAGFQTKSNFNREFRRVTGMSPMAWRAGRLPSR
ncbi:MAG TPA: AraC family transcriptional regulator [Dongiaceae bacterium]|jgi:AraC-like DNA-binding protein|nr:AraC family transcriptional regulator [Dongiaceae bacterium]